MCGPLLFHRGCAGDSLAPIPANSKGKTKMKLTKEQITEKREELCKVLVAMNRQKAKADNIKKDLADDFDKNEKAYRGGVVTAAGVLYRKPRFEVTAKEKVEVEG